MQPFLTASEHLKFSLLLVFKEPGGRFGQIVQEHTSSENLMVTIIAQWYKDVFINILQVISTMIRFLDSINCKIF